MIYRDQADRDAEAVRTFERDGWQQAAPHYRHTFAPATAGFVEALLDAAEVGPSARILDLCCGPGPVAAAAGRRGADVMGLDFSPAMLDIAREVVPQAHFDEGDAEALPYGDASFDAVVCNFGIHHVPRPERALAEARRVLRPGGRFAFTNWALPVENIAWKLLFDAIHAEGDPDAAKTPPSGGNLGRTETVLRLLDEAGFRQPKAARARCDWRVASPADLVGALRRGTVRTAALIAAQPSTAMPAIIAEVARSAESYRSGDGFAIPIAAILGVGSAGRGPA